MLIIVRVLVRDGVDLDQLCAEQADCVFLLLALCARHDNDDTIAERCPDQSKPDPGIACRSLDDGAARLQFAGSFRIAHNSERRPVLHGLARIEEFALSQDFAAGFV